MQTGLLNPPNRDLVTSLAFNARGTLLACTSLDSQVYIYSKKGRDWSLAWTLTLDSSVLIARFGTSGEFEGLLACGLVDGSVRVFSQESTLTKWVQRVNLSESRGSVRDLAFAPSSSSGNLKLASIGADDVLRVYECPQPTSEPTSTNISLSTATSSAISDPASIASSGLAHWSLLHAIDVASLPQTPCTANSTANLSGFSLSSSNTAATSSSFSLPGRQQNTTSTPQQPQQKSKSIESHGAWSLSWCKEVWYGECLAVSSGASGVVRIFELSPSTWTQPLVLSPAAPNLPANAVVESSPAPCTSLDWAPAVGRSFQLVAAGHRDGFVRIWKLFPPMRTASATLAPEEDTWRYQLTSTLEAHVGGGGIGRVEFNITGTVLSTAGDDGKVRLYKPTFAQEWREHAVLSAEETGGPSDMDE